MQKCNDPNAFHQFYHQHYDWLYQLLTKYLTSKHQIDNVLQDTFCKVLMRPELLLEIKDPRPFLAKTAKNIIIDRARRSKVEQSYFCTLNHEHNENCSMTPVDHLMSIEHIEQMTKAIKHLDERTQKVLTLYYLQGFTQVDIAKMLSLSTKTIRKDLNKALTHCQQYVQNHIES